MFIIFYHLFYLNIYADVFYLYINIMMVINNKEIQSYRPNVTLY